MSNTIPKYKQIKDKQQDIIQEEDEELLTEERSSTQEYIDSFTSKQKDRRFGFRIQTSSFNQFAKICKKEGISVSSKLNQLINSEIDKHIQQQK